MNQNKRKWVKAVNFIASHVSTNRQRGIKPYYWLEASDPKHRPASYLHKHVSAWKNAKTDLDLFAWLDRKEQQAGKQQASITYLEQAERAQYLVTIKNGYLYWQGKLLDTTHMRGKMSGFAAFVMDAQQQLYVAPHVRGKFQHSSFLAGDQVLCAGMLKVRAGKLVEMNSLSGHYQPTRQQLMRAAGAMPINVWQHRPHINYIRPLFIKLVWMLQNSQSVFLQQLGLALDRIRLTTRIPLAKVIKPLPSTYATLLTRGRPSSRHSEEGATPRSEPLGITDGIATSPAAPRNGGEQPSNPVPRPSRTLRQR